MRKKKKIYGRIIFLLFCMSVFSFFLYGFRMENQRLAKKTMASMEKNSEGEKEVLKKDETKGETKRAYLTFDDGPSDQTEKILDILKEKKVKATFFVVGKEGEKAKKIYRRILNEGNTLGIHSFSHDYNIIYSSLENYKADIEKLREYLKNVTGVMPTIYRFPGGSSNHIAKIDMDQCISYLEEEGIQYFDWNALNDDAVCFDASPETLNEKIMKDVKNTNHAMILMHDLHECDSTVKALPQLIEILQKEGYEILPITKNTQPVQHRKK